MAKRTILSDRLKGLEIDHGADRYDANAVSTGLLRRSFESIGEEQPIGWVMEFYCTACKTKFFEYHAEFEERIREALIENGVIPASNKAGPNY
jgi:hypothetical protein